jgi:hypothetical protein
MVGMGLEDEEFDEVGTHGHLGRMFNAEANVAAVAVARTNSSPSSHPSVTPVAAADTQTLHVCGQPDATWYKFNEGPMTIVFKDSRNIHMDQKWINPRLSLLYADTQLPVITTQGQRPFRETMRDIDPTLNTLKCLVKVDEITKNHQSRSFCFRLEVEGVVCLTTSFVVRTKRTKRKSTLPHVGVTQFRRVVSLLEWQPIAYGRHADGTVDYNHPIPSCPLCRATRLQGHTYTCAVYHVMCS